MGRGGGALPQAFRERHGRKGRRVKIQEGVRLERLTTVGVGGPARAFGRPQTVAELRDSLAWAAEHDLPVRPVGLGSNLLAADEGVEALVVRLAGELAAVEIRADLLVAGGGAANAVCLHRARDAGLGGLEFACADVVAVADVYPAREQPVEDVSGKLVVDALSEARPGLAPGWTPLLEDGARFVARRTRPGDLVLTVGAGDVDRAARLILDELGR